jgi:putative heme degradation protein
LRRHLANLCLHAVPHAPQVDVDDVIKLIILRFGHRGAVAVYTGIVESRVEPAKGFDHLLDHRFHLAPIRHVAVNGKDLMARGAQTISSNFEQRCVAICNNH